MQASVFIRVWLRPLRYGMGEADAVRLYGFV